MEDPCAAKRPQSVEALFEAEGRVGQLRLALKECIERERHMRYELGRREAECVETKAAMNTEPMPDDVMWFLSALVNGYPDPVVGYGSTQDFYQMYLGNQLRTSPSALSFEAFERKMCGTPGIDWEDSEGACLLIRMPELKAYLEAGAEAVYHPLARLPV